MFLWVKKMPGGESVRPGWWPGTSALHLEVSRGAERLLMSLILTVGEDAGGGQTVS